jgi:hypothetical protein
MKDLAIVSDIKEFQQLHGTKAYVFDGTDRIFQSLKTIDPKYKLILRIQFLKGSFIFDKSCNDSVVCYLTPPWASDYENCVHLPKRSYIRSYEKAYDTKEIDFKVDLTSCAKPWEIKLTNCCPNAVIKKVNRGQTSDQTSDEIDDPNDATVEDIVFTGFEPWAASNPIKPWENGLELPNQLAKMTERSNYSKFVTAYMSNPSQNFSEKFHTTLVPTFVSYDRSVTGYVDYIKLKTLAHEIVWQSLKARLDPKYPSHDEHPLHLNHGRGPFLLRQDDLEFFCNEFIRVIAKYKTDNLKIMYFTF